MLFENMSRSSEITKKWLTASVVALIGCVVAWSNPFGFGVAAHYEANFGDADFMLFIAVFCYTLAVISNLKARRAPAAN